MVKVNIPAVYPMEKQYKKSTLNMKTLSSEMLVLTWRHDPQDTLNIHHSDNLQSHYCCVLSQTSPAGITLWNHNNILKGCNQSYWALRCVVRFSQCSWLGTVDILTVYGAIHQEGTILIWTVDMLLVYCVTCQETLNMTCEAWGSHRGVAEDSRLLGRDAVVLDKWFQTFQGSTVPSKCREPRTQWHGITSHKTPNLTPPN